METAMAEDGNSGSHCPLSSPDRPVKVKALATTALSDPLLDLYGSGKDIWSDEHADEYVARLRGG